MIDLLELEERIRTLENDEIKKKKMSKITWRVITITLALLQIPMWIYAYNNYN